MAKGEKAEVKISLVTFDVIGSTQFSKRAVKDIIKYIFENYEYLLKCWEASMAKMKKPNLKQALKKVDRLPDKFFGKIDVDLSTLPCLKKVSREKITANFDSDVLEAIRDLAKKHHVSYTSLMNDVLRKVFVEEKKVG